MARLVRRALWVTATGLALAGIVVYLIWQTSWAYWVGGAMLLPLTLLVLTRTAEQTDGTHFGDSGSGPWTGP
jgi:hypothetical protein